MDKDNKMEEKYDLATGCLSEDGVIKILDQDRLCYKVLSQNKGTSGIRTISKAMLDEFHKLYLEKPNINASEARNILCGASDLDKFEYGYASTFWIMAKMLCNKKNLVKSDNRRITQHNPNLPLQQIIYGAPGTGKSFGVDEDIKKYGMKDIRTTFHPDSDYSTFVGAYKPQMEKVTMRDDRGIPVKDNGQVVYEKKIVYKYTQQAFLKAYIAAWKDLEHPHVLVIEEINRGNCAQIFGDLFQLLDRNDIGFSKYPIAADTDIVQLLNEEFEGVTVDNSDAINAHYKDGVVADVLNGCRMLLPNNLYIWATMNTSDQSLFPIDSAFKRRWEWKYVPISDAGKGWEISVNGKGYDWWAFVERMNEEIGEVTQSEDKKLGYFFCKADRKRNEGDGVNSIISAERFVGKVLFYVYNDVFKDYGFDNDIFRDREDGGKKLLFQSFFKSDGKPEEQKVEAFLQNLGLTPDSEMEGHTPGNEGDMDANPDGQADADTQNDIETEGNDRTKYTFDGKENLGKSLLGLSVMKKFINKHPELTIAQIKDTFPDTMLNGITCPGLIVEETVDLRSYSMYYSSGYKTSDNVNYSIFKQWTITNIQAMIDFAEEQGWHVEATE